MKIKYLLFYTFFCETQSEEIIYSALMQILEIRMLGRIFGRQKQEIAEKGMNT
jgi:hypothetical protein